LGLVAGEDRQAKTVFLRTPLASAAGASVLRLGDLALDLETYQERRFDDR
jgi:hypothetical protein